MVLTVFFFNWRWLVICHIDAISEYEFSGEELSDFTLSGDRSACLGSMVNLVDFRISLSLSDLFFKYFINFLWIVFRVEGPPTSRTL
jgi:hypothetical protein